MTSNPWGRGDVMALAAVRYCLGRQTYIVSDCYDWLLQVCPDLSPDIRIFIKCDVEEYFKRDNAARKRGKDYYLPLGHDMDRKAWEKVRELWRTES
jgi:hypothetical protein